MTTKQIEDYIEAKTQERFGNERASAYKYGIALALIDNCLDEMTHEQIERAFGPIEREAREMGIIK